MVKLGGLFAPPNKRVCDALGASWLDPRFNPPVAAACPQANCIIHPIKNIVSTPKLCRVVPGTAGGYKKNGLDTVSAETVTLPLSDRLKNNVETGG